MGLERIFDCCTFDKDFLHYFLHRHSTHPSLVPLNVFHENLPSLRVAQKGLEVLTLHMTDQAISIKVGMAGGLTGWWGWQTTSWIKVLICWIVDEDDGEQFGSHLADICLGPCSPPPSPVTCYICLA